MTHSATPGPEKPFLHDHLLPECEAMARHAFKSGLKVPNKLVYNLETIAALVTSKNDVRNNAEISRKLSLIHASLTGIVSPAQPGTIRLLEVEAEKKSFFSFLGPVPFIRRMMFASILCLILFILVSLSPDVNSSSGGILFSSGLPLLKNLVFLLSAAGLGASFVTLFQTNRYITESTFDPKFESYYWIKFVLGLVAGVILSELIPIDLSKTLKHLGKPTLAMLGGFSASIVYRVLNRLVLAVESIVQGEIKDQIAAREQAVKMRFEEQLSQHHFQMATHVMNLKQQFGSNPNPELVNQKLDSILNERIPGSVPNTEEETS